MNYCEYDYGAVIKDSSSNKVNSNGKYYFCDINENYYQTLKDCYDNCIFKVGNNSVHLSMVDMTFIFAVFGVLLGIAFFMAFHISHD
jgi:hypothetical protein